MKRLLTIFCWLSISCAVAQTTEPANTAPAQQFPSFKGGNDALLAFIVKNYTYPNSGETSVRFRVTAQGKIGPVKMVKSQGKGADKELIRVIKLTSGKWNPGRIDGKAVDMDFIQPFYINNVNQPATTTTPPSTKKPVAKKPAAKKS